MQEETERQWKQNGRETQLANDTILSKGREIAQRIYIGDSVADTGNIYRESFAKSIHISDAHN